MARDNTVTICGNVTRDPELKYLPSGVAVTEFGVAINERRRNPDTGEWEDGDPTFVDVTVWDSDGAENVAQSLAKGARVVLVGRLKLDQWQDKDTGDKRSKLRMVADEVGASMRWAELTIVRNERKEAGAASSTTTSNEDPFA